MTYDEVNYVKMENERLERRTPEEKEYDRQMENLSLLMFGLFVVWFVVVLLLRKFA